MNLLVHEHYPNDESIAYILDIDSLREKQPEFVNKIEQALKNKTIIALPFIDDLAYDGTTGFQNEDTRNNHIPTYPCTVDGEIEIWYQ
ncbi:MAG: hypothetical protein JRD89_02155 [Deltaproteobacteria bacterium]|nr:hypothetical protein [Deltaproteobacteria bacterium]